MIEAVIFDLDDTLLDSSAVADARTKGDWTTVKARLGDIRPFVVSNTSVERIPSQLKAAGLKVGVLTHSPRWYAETLLRLHSIRPDALVTGSDGYPPKPDPTSLKAIAQELGVALDRCVYVGDLHTDAMAAAAAGATSVGVAWSKSPPEAWQRWWPDVAIAKPERLLDLAALDRLRPLAEAVLAGSEPLWHWGTLMRLRGGAAVGLGRYLTPEDIERFPRHGLSHLVLNAKCDAAKAAEVAAIFERLADDPRSRDDTSLVVSVPPAPGAEFDRFAPIRAALAESLAARDGAGELKMNFAVDNYKRRAHDDRRTLNVGRFSSSPIDGGRVILIDDVYTSGSQAGSCRAALLAAGADTVDVVVLAVTQDRLPEGCPVCGASLRTYHRISDGRPFIGCPNFFTALSCPYTRDA